MLGRSLYRLARMPAVHAVVRTAFAHASWLLPVRRVLDTPTVLAFRHPRPSSPTHVLLVPKRAIPGLLDLRDLDVIIDIIGCACRVAANLGLTAADCALVVNGGRYQDVGQLHFHLVAGDASLELPPTAGAGSVRLPAEGPCDVFVHPRPSRTTHVVVRVREPLVSAGAPRPDAVRAAYRAAKDLARTQGLVARGFSVVLAGRGLESDCLHVVSGGRVARVESAVAPA
jgi:diadenosine tetraphosphate (Ap4A) HIT family hydrolase